MSHVMLESTTHNQKGEKVNVVMTGPWERDFIEGWVQHQIDESGCNFVKFNIVDCTEEDLKRPSPQTGKPL
ncbi:hypothetical protein VPHK469_0180 [Vibrio phage K469]